MTTLRVAGYGLAEQCGTAKRLLLASDAYQLGIAALGDRLAALEMGRNLAYSTDADDVSHP